MNIINSFANIYNFPKINKLNTTPQFTRGNSPLAPLDRDTVSFLGKTKLHSCASNDKLTVDLQEMRESAQKAKHNDKSFEHSEKPSLKLANTLYQESKYAYGHLCYALARTLDTDVLDVDSPDFQRQLTMQMNANKDKPILAVISRRKKPESICEKMAENHLRSKKHAKEELHDMIAARIILTGNSAKEGDYVLDKLAQAVSKNHIRIKSVKIHGQENPKTKYATKGKIDKLVNAARKNGNPLCSYSDKPRDSGYLALHIITDEIDDGYQAEIQIMGYDVQKFKELEDICYKCAFGKGVPKKYAPLAELLSQVNKSPVLKQEYLEYTKRAYEYERLKPFNPDNLTDKFLTIPSDLNIPSELDFNNLQSLKNRLDLESKKESEQ